MRTGDHAEAVLLRKLLYERGVDPQHAVLAEAFSDDYDGSQDHGIVIAGDGRVFEYVIQFDNHARNGFFREWNDRSDNWQDVYLPGPVEAGFELLRQEQARRPPP